MNEEVISVLQSYVETGVIPGARLYVKGRNGELIDETIGYRSLRPEVVPMKEDTVFDLASLTKVMGTTPLLLQLIGKDEISFQNRVAQFVPELREEAKQEITVEHLLTHNSGLPAHRPYYKRCQTKEDVMNAVIGEPLLHPPGERVTYSDPGFILAGYLIERVTGKKLEEVADEMLFHPLGMTDTSFTPSFLPDRFAATEGTKRGIVHDENAEAMGGIAGHAGLFSTTEDVGTFVDMWNNGGWHKGEEIIPTAMVEQATKKRAEGRGLGWEVDEKGFGHTGFTGTSIRFEKEWTAVLLTNRVHAGREAPIGKLRNELHKKIHRSFL